MHLQKHPIDCQEKAWIVGKNTLQDSKLKHHIIGFTYQNIIILFPEFFFYEKVAFKFWFSSYSYVNIYLKSQDVLCHVADVITLTGRVPSVGTRVI